MGCRRYLRIGRVALLAEERQSPGQRTSPSVLDRVAEPFERGRLADDTMVEMLAFGGGPFEQLRRAVDGRAFFVAGDEESSPNPRTGAFARRIVARQRERGREPALHIAGAASVEHAIRSTSAANGSKRQRAAISRWNHIGVAGENEIGREPSRSAHRGSARPAFAGCGEGYKSPRRKPAPASRSRR